MAVKEQQEIASDARGQVRRDAVAVQKTRVLKKINIALACVLAVVVAVLLVLWFGLAPQESAASKQNAQQTEYVNSDFALTEEPYDIYPGNKRVLYTNYACPYCADFWAKTKDQSFTVRLLLLDKDSKRFATQGTVSSFMLTLYRSDVSAFETMQDYLFAHQDEWVDLNDEEVLALLNEKAGIFYTINDLQPALNDCKKLEAQAPKDLEFVPALYEEGKRFDGYVLALVGD